LWSVKPDSLIRNPASRKKPASAGFFHALLSLYFAAFPCILLPDSCRRLYRQGSTPFMLLFQSFPINLSG
jgi:hypothetical protein